MRRGILCAFFFLFPLVVCFPTGIAEYPEAKYPETEIETDSDQRIENPETDFEWRIRDGNAVITKYIGESPDVVIPRSIQGHPVTEIGARAFSNSPFQGRRYHSVDIPNTVTRIGDYAFAYTSLTEIAIPNSVTHIGENAFASCGLTSAVIPRRVEYIGDYAFYDNKLVSVTLPRTLVLIGKSVFSENQLESIVIPEGVEAIMTAAFQRNKLISVKLPSTLTRIRENAFAENQLESVVIPEGVEVIEPNTFAHNKIRSVTFPGTLTSIGRRAFINNELHNVLLPERVTEIGAGAFAENPLREVTIRSTALHPMPHYVFHPQLPDFLPPGKYILGNDEWLVENPHGTLLSLDSFFREFGKDNPGVLATLLHDAINQKNAPLLRNCISWGADAKSRIHDTRTRRDNTPLAQAFYSTRWPASKWHFFSTEVIALLLEAGATAQHWMLGLSYLQPDITKMLLEHNALSNPESPEHGDPPDFYTRPASLLLHYSSQLYTIDYDRDYFRSLAGSAALLLEYGEDANYRDPQTGEMPLKTALQVLHSRYSPELTNVLLQHVSRPLSLEEYRQFIRLNREIIYRNEWWYRVDIEHEDGYGYDALVLEDIRNGILNPETKDQDGRDIFDYAATTGTAGLMQGLMPYLAESGRTILAPNRTGLYIDALNAGNPAAAAVLSTAMDHVFTVTDAGGQDYSLEFYAYDYETIYRSARQISEHSLHQTGPGGTRLISGGQTEIRYSPNALYVFNTYDDGLTLHTIEGSHFNLGQIINEAREQYYRESGREKPNNFNPDWHVARIFDHVLYAYNRVYYDEARNEYALVDISTDSPSVYIMETENLDIDSMTALYEPHTWISLLDNVMDFVIESGNAYLIRTTGEVLQFAAGEHSLQFEKAVSWRDCRIPGWKGGERVFVTDEAVEAYNFATGAVRPLGKKVEIPYLHIEGRNYLYEDGEGRRFVVEAKSGKAYPEPTEEFHNFALFEQGYIYVDENQRFYTVCFFEDGALKRKLVLSGSAMGDFSFSIHGDKMYLGMYLLAFTIDINTAQVSASFNTRDAGRNAEIYVYMFPFGTDDVVYTYTIDYGK